MKPISPCAVCGTLPIAGACIGSMYNGKDHIVGWTCGGDNKGRPCTNDRWIPVPPIESEDLLERLRTAGAV